MKVALTAILVAHLIGMSPQRAHSQTLQMVYNASDEAISAAGCAVESQTDRRPPEAMRPDTPLTETATKPEGRIQGKFVRISNNSPTEPSRPEIIDSLFYIAIHKGTSFHLSAGGNAFLQGDLISWNTSWLLCVRNGSPHFSWVDTSKPFLRILPEEESLTSSGLHERFQIQPYWHSPDPIAAHYGLSESRWILKNCGGVLIGETCIPFNTKRLDLSSTGLDGISFLSELPQLIYLDIGFNPMQDLSPLRSLRDLQELHLGEMRTDGAPIDISALESLENLVELNISENLINDLTPLSGLQHLEHIIAFGTDIDNLTPLANLESLRSLQIQETPVTDLTPLAGLRNLQRIYLSGTDIVDLSTLKRLPNLEVAGLPDGRDLIGKAQIHAEFFE